MSVMITNNYIHIRSVIRPRPIRTFQLRFQYRPIKADLSHAAHKPAPANNEFPVLIAEDAIKVDRTVDFCAIGFETFGVELVVSI